MKFVGVFIVLLCVNTADFSTSPSARNIINWPTRKVVVPSMVTRPGSLFGLQQPRWGIRHGLSVFNYQTHDPEQPFYNRNSKYGRENAAYFRFIVDHYDNLPETTVFVHPDAACHNRRWLEWLDCVRPGVMFAPLTYYYVVNRTVLGGEVEELDWLVSTFNLSEQTRLQMLPGQPRSFHCCEHWAISRDAIRRHPFSAYNSTYHLVTSDRISAYFLEFNLHVVFGEPVSGLPLDPCKRFHCERPYCQSSGSGVGRPTPDPPTYRGPFVIRNESGAKSVKPFKSKPFNESNFCQCVKRRTLQGSMLYIHPTAKRKTVPCVFRASLDEPRCNLPSPLPFGYIVDIGGCPNHSMDFQCHIECSSAAMGIALVECPVNGGLFKLSGCKKNKTVQSHG